MSRAEYLPETVTFPRYGDLQPATDGPGPPVVRLQKGVRDEAQDKRIRAGLLSRIDGGAAEAIADLHGLFDG